jgi:hypothetical protein
MMSPETVNTYVPAWKNAVEHRIEFQIFNAVGGISRTRCHVVPLQYLVENNSVKESSKAETEQKASQHGKLFELFWQRFTLSGDPGRCLYSSTPPPFVGE